MVQISIDTDILETGVINIVVFVGGIFILARDYFTSFLPERKQTIVTSVEDAEKRASDAEQRLIQAIKQFFLTKILINETKLKTLSARKGTFESVVSDIRKDLKSRFQRALAAFLSKERQTFLEINQQITSLILKRTLSKAQETFSAKTRAEQLITTTISKLEGDLL